MLQGGGLDEDGLYAALECLAAQQSAIEAALTPTVARGAVFLYDVTAPTAPQVRAMLQHGVLQMGLFEEQPAEVAVGSKCYVLRCDPASSLRMAHELVEMYRFGAWMAVRLEGRQVVWTEDAAAREPTIGARHLANCPTSSSGQAGVLAGERLTLTCESSRPWSQAKSTGVTIRICRKLLIIPPRTGAASGRMISEPVLVLHMIGSKPTTVVATVMTLGRSRSRAPSFTAWIKSA